jgi:UDP-GlcNAc:undecaprenyl-phosphate GlcNAc-1-phosphate transferase
LAAVVVGVLNIRFENIQVFDLNISLGYSGYIFSILWLVGVMNALNIIDGVDGLAACVSIIGFITVAVLANAKGSADIVVVCIILSGSTAGFLIHNVSLKKKTFLGDTGSLFLGAMLGLLCIFVTHLPGTQFPFFVPLLIVGYPIFDISVAMVRRFTRLSRKPKRRIYRRFLSMFEADNEHLHHRLLYWGLSHLRTTFLLALVAATMGSVAVIISRIELHLRMVVLAYLALSLLLILNRLRYIGMKNWITFPRVKIPRQKLVGVIEPNDVFFYSLKTYDQRKLEFINIPLAMSYKLKNQISAIIVYNASPNKFGENWNNALRAAEIHDCPVFIVADYSLLEKVYSEQRNLESIIAIKKPVRIPELIEEIEVKISRYDRSKYHLIEPQVDLIEVIKKESNA